MRDERRSSAAALVLTKRDARLFSELAKYGLLTTSQIESRIFPGVLTGTILRRLRRLEDKGWIYRIQAMKNGEHAWLLSRKGERAVRVKSPMIRPNRNGIEHDVLLTKLRHCLESIGFGENFVPEWTLRRQAFKTDKRGQPTGQVIPDAIFSATLWNKKATVVALELELHAKSTQRYERIFARYREKEWVGIIWYFTRSESFARSLLAKWNQTRPTSKWVKQGHAVLVATLFSEFETDPRSARLFWADGDTTPLSSLFNLAKKQNPAAQGVGTRSDPNDAQAATTIAS